MQFEIYAQGQEPMFRTADREIALAFCRHPHGFIPSITGKTVRGLMELLEELQESRFPSPERETIEIGCNGVRMRIRRSV